MRAEVKRGVAPIVATAAHLAWLKESIGQALASASDAARKGDLKGAAASVHQVWATLSFTRLQGAALFAATLEQLLREGDSAHADLIAKAVATLDAYLDRLHAGAADQALALYPAYRELRLAQGLTQADANTPSDLFFPDLSLRPPARDSDAGRVPPDAKDARLKAARLAFDRGWQKWRHGGKDDQARALRDMRNAVAIAEQQMASADERAFWWICIAFFDALADSPGEPGDPLRQELAPLLERIEQQVAELTEGAGAVSERLLRDVLYEVAVADSNAPSVILARSAYRLGPLMPKEAIDSVEEQKRREQRAILKAVLQAAKEDWNAFCAGSAAALPPFHEHAGRIAESAAALGLDVVPGFVRLAATVGEAASALRRNPLAAEDQLHEDLSMALLLLDDAVDQRTDNEAAFAHAADDLIERIHRLLAGEDLPSLHLPPTSQEAHQRLVSQVAAASAAQLREAQRLLAPVLAGIEPPEALRAPLRQVKGALALLGKHGASKVCEELLASLTPPAADTLAQAAADLALLTLYVEQLPWSSPDIQALRRAVSRSIPVIAASDQPFPSDPEEEAAALQAELDQLSTLSLEPLPAELESSIDPQQLPLFLKESRSRVAAIGDLLRRWRLAPQDSAHAEALQPLLADLKAAAGAAGALGIAELIQGLEDRMDGLGHADEADINQLEDGFDRVVALLDMLRVEAPVPVPQVATSEYETPLAIEPQHLDRLLDQVHEIAIGRRRVEAELRSLTADLGELGPVADRLREQMRALENFGDEEGVAADSEGQAAKLAHDLPALIESAADVATVKLGLQKGLERLSAILSDQTRLQRDISHGLLRLRMAPFSAISARLLNAVERERNAHGTPVSLAIEDDGAELDRTVLARVAAVLDLLLRKAAADRNAGPMALRVWRKTDEAIIEVTGLPADLPVEICGDHLAAVGGRMDADLDAGLLRLSVPAAPALSQALLVSAGGRRYGIPAALVEHAGEARAEELTAAERDGGILFADRFHAWHKLSALLGLPETPPGADGKRWRLLLHSGARQIALEVDALLGRQEVAMKSLGPQLSRVRGIAGATVLSDGEVLLLIDPVILASKASPSPAVAAAPTAIEEKSSAPVVLVVDDSPSARNTATRVLEKAGYCVITARDGVEALDRIADLRPALVIVDADMPRMSGSDLIHCLRSDPALKGVPLVLAGHDDYEIEPELGMVHLLRKPFEAAALVGLAGQLAFRP